MLSKKRQIMFDVIGKTRAERMTEVSPLVRTAAQWNDVARPTPRPKKPARAPSAPKAPKAPKAPRRPARKLALRGGAWWFAAAGVALIAIVFFIYRTHNASGPKTPVLQSNTDAPAEQPPAAKPQGESWSADTFAVLAMSEEYKNKAERKLAAERVQDAVDFCYRAGPDFRDVRGIHTPGKDQETGTYRVYVGSAKSRVAPDLVQLKEKLAALVWNRRKPFQKASVRMIERVSVTAKEASDER